MSSVKIYGHPLSCPSLIAHSVADYFGVKHDFQEVDLISGAQFKDDYKKLNPNSRVPVYEEGEFVLCEALAIARYLADRGEGSSLYPRELKKRALIDMHLSIMNDMRMHQMNLNY
jgi:glutathione S-transferase